MNDKLFILKAHVEKIQKVCFHDFPKFSSDFQFQVAFLRIFLSWNLLWFIAELCKLKSFVKVFLLSREAKKVT